MGKSGLTWLGIILLVGIFISVFWGVLEMRLNKGDIYPHYATMRTDPLGSSGLMEAFNRIPDYQVEQNYQSLMKIGNLDEDTTLLLLGVPQTMFRRIRIPDDSPVLEAIKEKGTRLVVTIDPQSVPTTHQNTLSANEDEWLEKRKKLREERRRKIKEANSKEEETSKEKPEAEDVEENDPFGKKSKKKKSNDESKDEEEEDSFINNEISRISEIGPRLTQRFDIDLADVKKFKRPEEGWTTKPGKSIQAKGLPLKTPMWKSQYRFEFDSDGKKAWKVSATAEGKPVVAERKLGKGSIVITTDSFFASNEALFNGGDSEFLLWLVGGKQRLVFDETMHGSVEKIGSIKLLREWRLHGLFIGLFVFILLWAWKSGTSLAPGDETMERGLTGGGAAVSGEDSKSGFIRLLQRSVPRNELLEKCLSTWKSSQINELPATKESEIHSIINRHKADPRKQSIVETYQKIADILRKR